LTERRILELAEAGLTVRQTAQQVERAVSTVENLVTRLNKRFGTKSRVAAARAARAEGLLPDGPECGDVSGPGADVKTGTRPSTHD
jgi:DNA-binding NarL/FixJ family response regulator